MSRSGVSSQNCLRIEAFEVKVHGERDVAVADVEAEAWTAPRFVAHAPGLGPDEARRAHVEGVSARGRRRTALSEPRA